jgi:quinoprotein glucose dehydrogenase
MRIRSEGQFAPLGVDQSAIVFPGFSGGAGWGGAAFDPETRLLYVNSTEMAWTGSLTAGNGTAAGRGLYLAQCAECHGDDLRGAPPQIPPLVDLRKRTTAQQVTAIIRQGKGRMPSFSNLRYDDALVLTEYLRGGPDSGIGESIRQAGKSFFAGLKEMIDDLRDRTKEPRVDREQARYRFTGYKKFLDLDNYPAVAPPWGTLNAVDLNTGQFAWRVPLGEYPALVARGVKNTGTENDGGLIVTAGGLVFIAATSYDKKLRAFDKSTGEVLWEATLPFAGNATPITYAIDGRQFIVIAAGGGKANGPSGGVYVAFALP